EGARRHVLRVSQRLKAGGGTSGSAPLATSARRGAASHCDPAALFVPRTRTRLREFYRYQRSLRRRSALDAFTCVGLVGTPTSKLETHHRSSSARGDPEYDRRKALRRKEDLFSFPEKVAGAGPFTIWLPRARGRVD